jgi:hypothetical protein
VLVFEQRHFLHFHNVVNSGRTRINLESYLKTMSYVHCRQSFFEKFRKQASVKSAIAKRIQKFRETGSLLDKNRNRQKSVLTPGILQDIQTAIIRSPHKSLRKLSAQTGISSHCCKWMNVTVGSSKTVQLLILLPLLWRLCINFSVKT